MTTGARPRLRRGVRLDHDPTRGRRVLLFPEGVLLLNDTAAAVVERCDGATTVTEIVDSLTEVYEGVQPEEVTALLDRLVSRRLLEVRDG